MQAGKNDKDRAGAILVHALLCAAINNEMMKAVRICLKASQIMEHNKVGTAAATEADSAGIGACITSVVEAALAVRTAVCLGIMWGVCAPPRICSLTSCTVEVEGSSSSSSNKSSSGSPNVLRKGEHGWEFDLPISKRKNHAIRVDIPPHTLLYELVQQYGEWAAELVWYNTSPPPALDSRPPLLFSCKLGSKTGKVTESSWKQNVWDPLLSQSIIPFIRDDWLCNDPPSEAFLRSILPASQNDLRYGSSKTSMIDKLELCSLSAVKNETLKITIYTR